MILEGIVTTLNAEGVLNVAPMGPRVAAEDLSRFVLRPFQSSTTYRNLKATGEGVLHVTDDALLLARTAIGLEVDPPTREAEVVRGRVLTGACRYYEFRVARLDDAEERTTIEVETVAMGRLRDFFGWNRAKHAVLEGAILATRVGILPIEEIIEGFERLIEPVRRTSGPAEAEAFELLRAYVEQAAKREGLSLGGSPT
jgi:hypothetical protein